MKKITQAEFEQEIDILGEGDYEVLGKYETTGKGVAMRHRVCGRVCTPSRDNFKRGNRCSHCFGKPKVNTKVFKERVYKLVGSEYMVIGEYITNEAKILIKHNICSEEYLVTPNKFTSGGRRCPKCYGNLLKTTEEFKKELWEVHGEEFTILGEYTGANELLEVRHSCGHEYCAYPNNLKRAVSCNNCSSASRGEEQIRKVLDHKRLSYQRQKKFWGCKSSSTYRNYLLPFDFHVILANTTLLIEYDGIQHYEPVEHFGGTAGFKRTKENDTIKTSYCEEQGIMLLRIPYWDFDNIEEILNETLEEHYSWN